MLSALHTATEYLHEFECTARSFPISSEMDRQVDLFVLETGVQITPNLLRALNTRFVGGRIATGSAYDCSGEMCGRYREFTVLSGTMLVWTVTTHYDY